MHMQLPGTFMLPSGTEAEGAQPEVKAVALDRLVLNRKSRKVKFYFRKSRCKRCFSDLSDEQIKSIFSAIRKIGRVKAENFVFEDDVYLVSPGTKRLIE